MTIHDRILQLVQMFDGGNKSAFSRRCGIITISFTVMFTRQTMPSTDMLLKIAQGTGASLDWLLLGRGSPLLAPDTEVLIGAIES